MPSPPTLKQADGTRIWYVHWTDAGPRGERGRSRRISTGTVDMDAAQAFFGEWLLMERGAVAPGKTFTVADLWTIYDTRYVQVKISDPDRHKYTWANLSKHFGALTLSEITEDTVSEYCQKRRTGRIGKPSMDSSIRLELAALAACFNWCADKKRQPKIIDKALVPNIDLPAPGEPSDRWLTADEIARLFKAAREKRVGDRMSRVERFLWLGLETASRKTAICELTWDRVDFEAGTIDYNVPGRKRTKKKRVVVPISKALLPVLQQMEREKINDHVMDGETDIEEPLKRVAGHAKVADVSPHVLRHTAATHWARRGVSIWIIAKILGNTVEMVERVYAKHCPDDLRQAVDSLPRGVVEADDLRQSGAQNSVQNGPVCDIHQTSADELPRAAE